MGAEPARRLPEPGERPISMADIAGSGDPVHPAPFDAPLGAPPVPGAPPARGASAVPLFGSPAEGERATTFGELLEPREPEWPAVDVDPGRRSGVVAIVVGFFVGLVGVFIGIASIRSSRRVGLTGALGTAGIVVSVLNILVGGVVGISWVRYEVSLQQQCALVGPGQYVTQSGGQVTCP